MSRAKRGYFISGLFACLWLIFFALFVYKDHHVVSSDPDEEEGIRFQPITDKIEPLHSLEDGEDILPQDQEGLPEHAGPNSEEEINQVQGKDQGEPEALPPSQTVYLTFDDGPSHVTEELVALLNEYGIESTFFMLEPRMKRYAQSVKAIVEHGHATGLHGVTHDRRKFYKSKKTVLTEMEKARRTLLEIGGVESRLIRVPYGSVPHMKPEYFQVIEENGYILWDWNVDSRDWYYRDKRYVKEVLKQVEQVSKRGEAPVVLLHDLEETYRHLPDLLDRLGEKGNVFAKISADLDPVQFTRK